MLLADAFQPAPGAFELFEAGEHGLGRAAGADREPGGDQRVLDLEFADQRQPHGDSCRPRCSSTSFCAKPSIEASHQANALARPIGLAPDRDDAQTARIRRLDHLPLNNHDRPK
mgnify:CR=1 FL=1